MSKRTFRTNKQPATTNPTYPTFDEFALHRGASEAREQGDVERGRRDFLSRLGLLGAVVLGAGALMACGDRPVNVEPDQGGPSGAAPLPDAGIDQKVQEPDFATAGVARQPDWRILKPDAEILAGGKSGPDARIEEPDLSTSQGFAPQPDAGKR